MGLRYCCDNCGGDAEKVIELNFKLYKITLTFPDTHTYCVQCIIHNLQLKIENERTEKQA